MTPRGEGVDAKALRLLAGERVTLTHVQHCQVEATVDGDSDRYLVTYLRGRWTCTCPCLTRCSHRTAVQLVTDPTSTRKSPTAMTTGQRSTLGRTRTRAREAGSSDLACERSALARTRTRAREAVA